MKREDIYTLDEELPKRVKARFVSAGKYPLGIRHVNLSSSPSVSQAQQEAYLGIWIDFQKANATFPLLMQASNLAPNGKPV